MAPLTSLLLKLSHPPQSDYDNNVCGHVVAGTGQTSGLRTANSPASTMCIRQSTTRTF